VLGYRPTAAGLRKLRLRVPCPAWVIADSSLRSRPLRCDVECRAYRTRRFSGGRRSAVPWVRGSVGPSVAQAGLLSVSPARNRSYAISSPKRYWH
jgi:hypothetical protein